MKWGGGTKIAAFLLVSVLSRQTNARKETRHPCSKPQSSNPQASFPKLVTQRNGQNKAKQLCSPLFESHKNSAVSLNQAELGPKMHSFSLGPVQANAFCGFWPSHRAPTKVGVPETRHRKPHCHMWVCLSVFLGGSVSGLFIWIQNERPRSVRVSSIWTHTHPWSLSASLLPIALA